MKSLIGLLRIVRSGHFLLGPINWNLFWCAVKDIENKRYELKGKVTLLNLDGEIELSKIKDAVLKSLKGVFEDIELSEKKKRSIESLLTQKLTGRLKEFKGKEYDADVMKCLSEVQDEVFDLILENDNIFKLYEMRYEIYKH